MSQNMKDIFRIRLERLCDFLRGFSRLGAQTFLNPLLKLEHARRRLLPRFDAGLMVGVDVHDGGIESDRALIQGNERADVERVHFRDRDRNRFASALVKCGASPAQEALKIIAARHALLDLELVAPRGLCAPRQT